MKVKLKSDLRMTKEIQSAYCDRGGWYYFTRDGGGPYAEQELKGL